MIRAVIFDIFGVLTIDGWLKFCDQHFPEQEQRQKAQELNQQTDAGKLDYDEFLKKIEQMSGMAAKEIDAQLYERLPKNEQLLDFIKKELKGHYKLGILSNIANADWIEEYFNPDELSLFDEIVTSAEEGMIKPDPEIYKITAKRLGVTPQECIFIDDRAKFVAAAEQVGMRAILYEDFPKFKANLQSLLASSNN